MKTKVIKQSAIFRASPHEIFELLMNSKKHSAFTGSNAKISRKVGGKFSVYEDGLSGTNLAIVKDKKIVQSWRCEMDGWPKDYYSKATFSLKKIKDGTRLDFVQTGVPSECFNSISKGWHDFYWKPMKSALEN